jgi:thioredoxin-dependent peroxiredoxin
MQALIAAIGALAAALSTSSALVIAGSAPASAPGPGAAAPAVALKSVVGGSVEPYDLQTAVAKRPVVLYFFPKAYTSGCTIEAKTFAVKYADFEKLGYDVVGASTDDTDTLAKFQHDEQAPQRFVSDPGGTIASAFGIAEAYKGKVYAGRVTYVIGTDGKILFKVEDDVPESNVAATYAWVKQHPNVQGGS